MAMLRLAAGSTDAALDVALLRIGILAPVDLTIIRSVVSRPAAELVDSPVKCPCVWKTDGAEARPVPIPRYNNENRWYIEKYQSIVSLFE